VEGRPAAANARAVAGTAAGAGVALAAAANARVVAGSAVAGGVALAVASAVAVVEGRPCSELALELGVPSDVSAELDSRAVIELLTRAYERFKVRNEQALVCLSNK